MDKAVHWKSISVILCNKSIAKVGLALGQYIIGDITPPFYDLQKTVYECTYFVSDFRAGDGSPPPPLVARLHNEIIYSVRYYD